MNIQAPPVAEPAPAESTKAPPKRLVSVDAYRGLVMFLMMAEVLETGAVAKALPKDTWWQSFWQFLHTQQSHVEWVGCALHDLIQPSFSFLVGVALPFSLASRVARGQSLGKLWGHTLWRAFILVALGIFLRSLWSRQTNFTFEDTLSQIGLGYPLLVLLGLLSVRVQWGAFVLIVVGYWAAFAWYPLPGPEFDWKAAGVAADWPNHLPGFAAHWNKNTNLAWHFDRWFMNLFPREKPFLHNGGGYATLSFIPTLGTMLLGLLAGGWLKADLTHREKLLRFGYAGLAGLALGLALHILGVCPIVKPIWTPAWVLFSGGWCFLFLAAFYLFIEVGKLRWLFFPLTVIGMNSIAAYCMDWMQRGIIGQSLDKHLGTIVYFFAGLVGKRSDIRLGPKFFDAFQPYTPFVHGALVLLVMWLILFWMYRRKLFLKI